MKYTPLLLKLIDLITLLGMLIVSVATVLALVAADWWLGDILSHLRVQLGLALCLALIWLVLRRRWLPSLFVLLPLLVNLSVLVPLYQPRPASPQTILRPLRILHYNLDMTARDHTAAFQYMHASAPDILLVQELTPALAKQIGQALPEYRLVYAHPLDNTHGSAILLPTASDLQLMAVGEVHLPQSSPRPLITATLALEGQPFTLLSWHVIRPKDAYTEEIQGQEYAAASQWIREQQQQGYPMIVIGDYNTTPWSARFQRFLQESGLRDSSLGFGFQPTWPAFAPGLFAIPIDHAVISPAIVVRDRKVGPDLGGDHRPLELTIALN